MWVQVNGGLVRKVRPESKDSNSISKVVASRQCNGWTIQISVKAGRPPATHNTRLCRV